MAPAKLTDQDKQTLLERYRQPGITAADLAAEFGVSSSTISRILRSGIDSREYERLQWLKRQTPAISESAPVEGQAATEAAEMLDLPQPLPLPEPVPTAAADRSAPIRRRSSAGPAPDDVSVEPSQADAEAPKRSSLAQPSFDSLAPEEAEALEIDARELAAIADSETPEEFSAFGDEFDLGSDEEEDGEEGEATGDLVAMMAGSTAVQVLPLANAQLPRVLYLVVDRLGDLVTCPLSSFPELGWTAGDESEAQVLPLFDNHRVAKRFCKRSQKVLKVPDSRLLGKTQQWLIAKGICRFLLDGNLYALN